MCVRAIMAERAIWTGSASDLCAFVRGACPRRHFGQLAWPKNPRALAGRLRRAQTFLRTLGIEIAFSVKGGAGTRMIRVSRSAENSVSTVSTVSAARSNAV